MVLRTNLDTKIAQFVAKTEAALDTTVRTTMLDLGFTAAAISPVLTGRFRASWRISQNTEDTSTAPEVLQKSAVRTARRAGASREIPLGGTFGRLKEQAFEMRAGGIHYLTNSVPYAEKINDGDPKTGREPALIVEQLRLLFNSVVARSASKAAV
tara:strand:+ start:1540 stop:2004 length:465 start_codon:yes stop_codon:yes gene_type:complete